MAALQTDLAARAAAIENAEELRKRGEDRAKQLEADLGQARTTADTLQAELKEKKAQAFVKEQELRQKVIQEAKAVNDKVRGILERRSISPRTDPGIKGQ